jgi:hypothetical protein
MAAAPVAACGPASSGQQQQQHQLPAGPMQGVHAAQQTASVPPGVVGMSAAMATADAAALNAALDVFFCSGATDDDIDLDGMFPDL